MIQQPIDSTPKADGFFMPAEWSRHVRTWMLWPVRPDNWRQQAQPAQTAFLNVASAIAQFEPVCIGTDLTRIAELEERLGRLENRYSISAVQISSDDAWCRDVGPTFVINDRGDVRGVDWTFNAWGGHHGGLYSPWCQDDLVASRILQLENLQRYRTDGFVLEGGAIHVDGQGTALVTEECLLHSNRNPHLEKTDIEKLLNEYLGVRKILWIQHGIVDDETDGHIDNMACFARPGEIILAWTEDQCDSQYPRCHAAWDRLQSASDAVGRRLKVHRLLLPSRPVYSTHQEYASLQPQTNTKRRSGQDRLAASYVNFYLCNGGLILPTFDDPHDQLAQSTLAQIFPERTIVPVASREIVLGGGNVHCITQQQPAGI